MTTIELFVSDFLSVVSDADTPMKKAKEFMTKTLQIECERVGGLPVDANIIGLHQLLKRCTVAHIKELPVKKPLVKDCEIKFTNKDTGDSIRYVCRLTKEIDLRKPSEDGTWGINVNSFKPIK